MRKTGFGTFVHGNDNNYIPKLQYFRIKNFNYFRLC